MFRLFGIYSFFQTTAPDTVFVGVWAMDMHVHSFVCVFSLSCVIAAFLCLCRGSVDMERENGSNNWTPSTRLPTRGAETCPFTLSFISVVTPRIDVALKYDAILN